MGKSNSIQITAKTEPLYTFKVLNNDIASLIIDIADLASSHKAQYQHAPVILDVQERNFQANELAMLVEVLTQHNIVPIGIRTKNQELIDFAKFSGLAVFGKAPTASVSGALKSSADKPIDNPYQVPRIVADKVRDAKQILAKGSDLVLLNTVELGAEVIADGSISAYKQVHGKVFAGASGNEKALIFIHSFNAQLVCIAGVYKAFDSVPTKFYKRPIMIKLKAGKLRFQIP